MVTFKQHRNRVFWLIAGLALGVVSLVLYWANLQLLVWSGDLSAIGVAAYLTEVVLAMSFIGAVHERVIHKRS